MPSIIDENPRRNSRTYPANQGTAGGGVSAYTDTGTGNPKPNPAGGQTIVATQTPAPSATITDPRPTYSAQGAVVPKPSQQTNPIGQYTDTGTGAYTTPASQYQAELNSANTVGQYTDTGGGYNPTAQGSGKERPKGKPQSFYEAQLQEPVVPKPSQQTAQTNPIGAYTDTGTGSYARDENGNIIGSGVDYDALWQTMYNNMQQQEERPHVITQTVDSVAPERILQQQAIVEAANEALNGGGDNNNGGYNTTGGGTNNNDGGYYFDYSGGNGGAPAPTTTQTATTQSETQTAQTPAVTAEPMDYDLSEYLRQQYASRIEAELAGLASAYEQSRNGYEAELSRIAPQYQGLRNQTAAQDAIARRNFDERAAASGLNNGTAGQADLARSSAYTGELARIGMAEENARNDVNLQMANAQSAYEQAIAQAKAKNDQELAAALYQEMLRVQGLEREDRLRAEQKAEEAAKPILTAAQTLSAMESGYINPTTQAAFNYYFGQDYTAPAQTSNGGNGGYYYTGGGSNSGTGNTATDAEAEAKTASTLWDAADAYAAKYGEDAGLAYVKANYKELGYSSQSAAEYAYQLHKYDTGRMTQETPTAPTNNPSTQIVGGLNVDGIANRITYSPRNEPLIWVEGTPPTNEPQYDADGNVVPSKYYFKTPTWEQLVDYMRDGVVKGEIRNGKYVYSWT